MSSNSFVYIFYQREEKKRGGREGERKEKGSSRYSGSLLTSTVKGRYNTYSQVWFRRPPLKQRKRIFFNRKICSCKIHFRKDQLHKSWGNNVIFSTPELIQTYENWIPHLDKMGRFQIRPRKGDRHEVGTFYRCRGTYSPTVVKYLGWEIFVLDTLNFWRFRILATKTGLLAKNPLISTQMQILTLILSLEI